MAQFIAFEERVEVSGQSMLSAINASPFGQEQRSAILRAYGIDKPAAGRWYPQQAWLNAIKELSGEAGDNLLFSIGLSIPEYVVFPSGINTLENALKAIDRAYQMNHRGGEIGSYRVVDFNGRAGKAVMVCQTPYPSAFDRGIISRMLEKFRPASSSGFSVHLDTSKSSRIEGKHSCTYNIYW